MTAARIYAASALAEPSARMTTDYATQSLSSTFQYARSTKCRQLSCCCDVNVTCTNGRHFGRFGLRIKRHVRFMRQSIALARVTRNAGANHVFPSRQAAAIARHHVIEIQIAAIENMAAILAGVFVALENVVPGKLHFLLRQPIEE